MPHFEIFDGPELGVFRGRTYDEMFMPLARNGCVRYSDAKVIVTDMIDANHEVQFERDGVFQTLNSTGPLTEAMSYFCSQTAQKWGVSKEDIFFTYFTNIMTSVFWHSQS